MNEVAYGNGYPQGGLGSNPFASVCAPFAGALKAAPGGVVVERFGWADPDTGQVSNVYQPGFIFGIVLPQPQRYARNGWLTAYWNGGPPGYPQNPGLVLRGGQFVALAAVGDFWLRFPLGAQIGAQVWANQADGTPATGVGNPWTAGSDVPAGSALYMAGAGAYQPTGWTCMHGSQPGGRALISSWSKPF